MLHRVVAAGLKNVVEADHIALNVGIRVGDRVPHTSLGTEVDHNVRVVLLEDAVDESFICEIAFNKGIVLELLEFSQSRFLDADIVVVVHVIQTDNFCVRLRGEDTLSKV